MAHFEKFTQSATFAQFKHDKRDGKTPEHIDTTRTKLNYNLATVWDPWQFVKDKIAMSKNTGGRVNSRTVATVSCIITLPKGFKGDVGLFFETAKQFLDNKFGAENCASCWIHFDEAQPHMHWRGCPILETVKTDENGHPKTVQQFNAKKVVSRSMLKKFHKELDDHLATVFGHSVGILNGATVEGNITVPQLKKQQQKVKEAQQEYETLIDDYNALVDEYNELLEQVDSLSKQCSQLKEQCKEYRRKLLGQEFSNEVLGDDGPEH